MSWLAWVCVSITILLWGSAFTGISIALEGLSPGALALARFSVASVLLLTASMLLRVPIPTRRDLPRLAALGAIGIATYHLLLNTGQRTVPPGTSALLIQTAPIFTTLLAARFLGERITRWGVVGMGIAAAGTALLVLGSGRSVTFAGDALLIVGAAVATSVYFVFQRPLVAAYGPLSVTTWTIVLGTLPLLVFTPTLVAQWPAATPTQQLTVLWIGAMPAALAYVLWNRVIREVGAQATAPFLYVSPLVAMLSTWAWNGTVPTALSALGGAITLAGVALVQWARRRQLAAAIPNSSSSSVAS